MRHEGTGRGFAPILLPRSSSAIVSNRSLVAWLTGSRIISAPPGASRSSHRRSHVLASSSVRDSMASFSAKLTRIRSGFLPGSRTDPPHRLEARRSATDSDSHRTAVPSISGKDESGRGPRFDRKIRGERRKMRQRGKRRRAGPAAEIENAERATGWIGITPRNVLRQDELSAHKSLREEKKPVGKSMRSSRA